jgi:hypothetical protein
MTTITYLVGIGDILSADYKPVIKLNVLSGDRLVDDMTLSPEVAQWCEDNAIALPVVDFVGSRFGQWEYSIDFVSDEDALVFKLKWL